MRWLLLGALAAYAADGPTEVPTARPGAPVVPDATIELPCGFQRGESHVYRLEKASTRTDAGGRGESRTVRATVTVTVLSHDATRSVLDVRYSDTTEQGTVDLGESMAAVATARPIRVALDHGTGWRGKPDSLRVINLDEVMAEYERVGGDLKAALKKKQPRGAEQVIAWIDHIVADRALAEQRALADLQPLFAFTCGAVPVGEVRYETGLQNPLGGADLPATGTLVGTPDDATLRVEVTERLDPVGALEVIGPMLAAAGVPIPADVKLDELQLEMQTDLAVEVDRRTGWPRRWSSERRGTVMGQGRVDTVGMIRAPAK